MSVNLRSLLYLQSVIAVFLLLGISGCHKTSDLSNRTNPVVIIETSLGDITLELNPEKAPVTVENFLQYVDEGYYDSLIFHRVIPDFMIQGGGFTTDMKEKLPQHPPIKNEAGNGLINRAGTIAMARTQVVDSATSQFFINTKDNPFLNHRDETNEGFGYVVFGNITSGMDIVKKIEQVQTTTRGYYENIPVEPVIIKYIHRLKR